MWCCLGWRRRRSLGGGDRTEKQREYEVMPHRRNLAMMQPRREQAMLPRERRIPPERRETFRTTTEFKWPPRMGDVMLSSPSLVNYHTGSMVDIASPEKEAALPIPSPISFHFAPEPVYSGQDYHISPQVSQDMLSHKYKYGRGAALPDLAELPPNELVPQQVHELAGPTPPVLIFPQELEGNLDILRPPRLQRSPTPTSRFSSRR